jgi:hypothetical protein
LSSKYYTGCIAHILESNIFPESSLKYFHFSLLFLLWPTESLKVHFLVSKHKKIFYLSFKIDVWIITLSYKIFICNFRTLSRRNISN